jgi:hypothetical protein
MYDTCITRGRADSLPTGLTRELADRTAFIFNLTTGDRRDQIGNGAGEFQTWNFVSYGPTFGGGYDIGVSNALTVGSLYSFTYCPTDEDCQGEPNLLGETNYTPLDIGDLEVFTISTAEVPLPAAAWLLLSGAGGMLAMARRRRAAAA